MIRIFCSLVATSFLLCASSGLRAQEVVGESVISVTATQVITYSATEMDYTTSYYYDAEADGFLWQNGTVIRSGYALGNPTGDGYMSAPTVINSTYEIQTNHWLIAYYYVTGYGYDDPYGYGLIDGGGYGGTGDIYAPGTPEFVGASSYYIGSTYVATTSNEPVVTALQVWSGDPVQGGSGYLVLYGTDLTTYWGATTVASSSGVSTSVTYESPTQINLSFMIDGGATVGTDTVSVSDLFGISSQPFTIYSSGSGWVAEDGLSGVVTSSVEDPDGTWEFSMSQDDFTTLYANTQEYFQSCGCQDISNVLQTWGIP